MLFSAVPRPGAPSTFLVWGTTRAMVQFLGPRCLPRLSVTCILCSLGSLPFHSCSAVAAAAQYNNIMHKKRTGVTPGLDS